MFRRKIAVFSTEQVANLLGLDTSDKWRVIKFTMTRDYGISPSVRLPSGSGTRRLYDLEDVLRFALALRLQETGLRSKVIGKVIKQLGSRLSSRLGSKRLEYFLAIVRSPKTGALLSEKRQQKVYRVNGIEEANRKRGQKDDLILIPIGSMFADIKRRLGTLEKAEQAARQGEARKAKKGAHHDL